jgi:hypothetical protein
MRILLLGHSPLNLDTNRLGALTRLKDGLRPAAARRVVSAMIGAPLRRPVSGFDAAAAARKGSAPTTVGRVGAEAPLSLRRGRAAQIVVGGRVLRDA